METMPTEESLRSILFAALDDYLNGRVSAEYAKAIARLAKEAARIRKQEVKSRLETK